jgi:thioredoxin reductase
MEFLGVFSVSSVSSVAKLRVLAARGALRHGLLAGRARRQGVPGIFAAGDVRANANRRVAAAVGEGSAATFSVHQYLRSV